MSFAYLPLYTGDYLRDTQHLSCSEHGIYLKFLMHCWDQKGPIPLDERKQQGICNARSGDEIEAMRRVMGEFFIQMDDGWYNQRMQNEIERAENVSSSRSIAGKLGYQARAKHLLSKSQASASSPSPTPIPIPIPRKTKPLSGKPDANPLAIEILEFLNRKAGRAYRQTPKNLAFISGCMARGASVADCKQVIAKKVREWTNDPKMDTYLRPKTLFNETNFDQYVGELVEEPDET